MTRASKSLAMRALLAREALRRGALTQESSGIYRGGFRRFGRATVEQLVANGEALRLPDGRVVKADAGA
jgi:hypothetical protein